MLVHPVLLQAREEEGHRRRDGEVGGGIAAKQSGYQEAVDEIAKALTGAVDLNDRAAKDLAKVAAFGGFIVLSILVGTSWTLDPPGPPGSAAILTPFL